MRVPTGTQLSTHICLNAYLHFNIVSLKVTLFKNASLTLNESSLYYLFYTHMQNMLLLCKYNSNFMNILAAFGGGAYNVTNQFGLERRGVDGKNKTCINCVNGLFFFFFAMLQITSIYPKKT